MVNDFVSDEEFDRLLLAWFGNLARVLLPGRAFYIWGGYANCANYPPVLKATGLYFSQAIIWDKQHPVLTRKDYMGAHELCFYGWREGAAHRCFPLGTPYTEIVPAVARLASSEPLRDSPLVVDQTGVGRPVVDMLRQAAGSLCP